MGRKKGFFESLISPPRRRKKDIFDLLFGRGGLFDFSEPKRRKKGFFEKLSEESKPRRRQKW